MNQTLVNVLFLALLALVAACSSSEPASREDEQAAAFADLRSAVVDSVTDTRRQAEVLGIIDALEKDVDDLRALLIRRRVELRQLNANYDATRAEFLEFASQMELRIQNGRRHALQQHLSLAAALTADEWAAIQKVQTRAMRSIAESVQGI